MNIKCLKIIAGLCLAATGYWCLAADGVVTGPVYAIEVDAGTFELGPAQAGRMVQASTLATFAGVDAVQQGMSGAQSDVQVFGGGFNASGIALGTVAVRQPQTEHFQAELPLPLSWFEQPLVTAGMDAAGRVAHHTAGTIELMPGLILPGLSTWFTAGNHHLVSAGASLRDTRSGPDGVLGYGVFGSAIRVEGMDYPDNDLESWQAAGRFQYRQNEDQVDLMAGVQHRSFGARGYYGAPEQYPSYETVRDTTVLAGWDHRRSNDEAVRSHLLWRRVEDRYELDRTRPEFYRNAHDSDMVGWGAQGAERLWWKSRILWQGSLEADRLRSSSLGDHDRNRADISLVWEERVRPWVLLAGPRVQWFEHEQTVVSPQVGIRSLPSGGRIWYATYAGNARQPSFTERYYQSISSSGNESLPVAESRTTRAGVRWEKNWWQGEWSVFVRKEQHTVDWVWDPASSKWLATDLGDVETRGLVAGGDFDLGAWFRVRPSYTFLNKESLVKTDAGRYVMDYPEHQARVDLTWRVWRLMELRTAQTVRYQVSNTRRRGDRWGGNGEAQVVMRFRSLPSVEWSLACNNLWDDDFEQVPSLVPPARIVSASVRGAW
ncbi:MAG: hypothetical protein A2269_03225 [Lentisphaerae bacterium RIFOXYA12_FULL_60_10]|nr:MAG: hypothetical protein A2269_03225 [Lentisphaerae bacterium RIFOXYA12_FULL_60_10]